jgi:hypothetical protein
MAQLKYWDGSQWVNAVIGVQGLTGQTGIQGVQGIQGILGVQGTEGNWTTAQILRSVTGASDTPTSADNGKLITIDTTSGAVTITINSSLGLSAGQRIDFAWIGAATSITFSASSTTVNGTPGLKLRARYSAATLVCLASNTYVLVGDLIA